MRLFWCNCLKSWYVICVLKMNLCFDLISLCETTKTSKKKYKRTYYVACFQVMRLLFYSLIVLYTDNGGCDIEPDVGRYSRLFLVGFLFKRSVLLPISTWRLTVLYFSNVVHLLLLLLLETENKRPFVLSDFLVGFITVLCIGNYFRAKLAQERQRQRKCWR